MSTIAQMTGDALLISNLMSAQSASIARSQERLATGTWLNSAADGPAELGQAVRMQTQIRTLGEATKNGQSALSVVQVAQGGYTSAQSILDQMAQLVTAAGDPTADKTSLQAQFTDLSNQLDSLASSTSVNGTKLLDGSQATTGMSFLIGSGSNAADYLNVKFASVKAADLGLSGIDLTTATSATLQTDATAIQNASNTVTTANASAGGTEDVINIRLDGLTKQSQVLSDAYDRFTGTDVALESANISRQQILQQASAALLSQARVSAANTMQLLVG